MAGVTELTGILGREGFLWCPPTPVSQQAGRLKDSWPFGPSCWRGYSKNYSHNSNRPSRWRTRRLLAESIQLARRWFEQIWSADSSTWEALGSKLKSWETLAIGQLAGKMTVVIDLSPAQPMEMGFDENPRAWDTWWEKELLAIVKPQTRMLLSRGFYHFQFWHQLTEPGVDLITRVKKPARLLVEEVFTLLLRSARGSSASGFGNEKDWIYYLRFDRSSFGEHLAFLPDLRTRPSHSPALCGGGFVPTALADWRGI